MKKLLLLFATFFKIGLFTFGGGYAMLSLIQSETVSKKKWLSGDELLDIIAVAESTPGPISINCATYIGYRQAGVLGSIFATLGVVLPSFAIIFAISFFIDEFLKIDIVNKAFRGIQAAVAILIVRAGFKMAKNFKKDVMSFVLLGLAMVFTITLNFVSFNLSSIYLIIFGGLVGFVVGLIKSKRSKDEATDPAIKVELNHSDPASAQTSFAAPSDASAQTSFAAPSDENETNLQDEMLSDESEANSQDDTSSDESAHSDKEEQ